jgi:esterase/lipase superfamily enzyme
MKYISIRWQFHLSILFSFLVYFQASAGAAEKASTTDGLIRVPIFFITDRNLQPSKLGNIDFGPHRKYVGDCKHDPFMGSAYCVVENVDHKAISSHLQDLGWAKAEPKDKVGAFAATPLTNDSFEIIQKQFYDKVHTTALLCPDKNVVLFAHGYNNSFVTGLHTAAKLAYNAERPLILYSWPSVGKLRSYDTDETNVEWSQEHYNDVITHLEQMCTEDPSVKVRLMAHSMGNRLLVRATPLLREQPFLLEAVLICPDVDNGLVQHYIRRYMSAKGTAEIRVYMSRHDKALAFSQLVHGGYTRLGEQADALGGWITKTLTAQNADTDTVVPKIQETELKEKLSVNRKRMQTIDFTNIDTGFIGHNVPAKLVCGMSFNNSPPPGLELISEQSGLRSGLSNFFTKLTKLTQPSETSLTGEVFHVVRSSELATAKSNKSKNSGKSDSKDGNAKDSDSKDGNLKLTEPTVSGSKTDAPETISAVPN